MIIREKTKIFGSSLDVLDGREKVEIKRAYMCALGSVREFDPGFLDPYDGITSLAGGLLESNCEKVGKIPCETWLTPKPPLQDLSKVTSERYKAFLEAKGCQRYSELAGDFVNDILPSTFAMIGVDHSQTGGVVSKLSEHYSPNQISLIVLDAHTDMFDFDLAYAVHRESTEGMRSDFQQGSEPLYNNSFYCCGNFLRFLLEEKTIMPENLYLIGVADYPGEPHKDESDSAAGTYYHTYMNYLEQGVKVIPKAEVESANDALSRVLSGINTPYAYISVDMDVGALASTCAVRFLNTMGMQEELIYRTINTIKDTLSRKNVKCLGVDLMEMDVHFAGYPFRGVRDRSYDIASNIIRILLETL